MIVRTLLFALPLLWLAPPASAAITPTPTLVYAFSRFEPYKTVDADGKPGGPYTVLLQELARRSGVQLDIVHCPLQRCLALLQRGQADLSIGIRGNAERDRYLDFLDPPFAPPTATMVLQRHDDPRPIRHYDDLYALRVGVVEGASYFQRFDDDRLMRRDAAPSARLALRKLAAKRFDVLLINAQQGRQLSRELGARQYRRAELQFPGELPRRIALSRLSPAVQAAKPRLAAQLQQMLRDGSVRRILDGAAVQAAHAGSKRSGRSLHSMSTPH
jgi:polar amino acid transport system substrate-binding protein